MANETIDKIITDLRRVEQIVTSFQHTAKVPDIERDIALAKLRNIYEFIQFLEVEKPMELPKIKMEAVKIIQESIHPKEKEMPENIQEAILEIELLSDQIVELPVQEVEIPVPQPQELPHPEPVEIPSPHIPEPTIPSPAEIPVQKPGEIPSLKTEVLDEKPFEFQPHQKIRKTEATPILAEKFMQNKSFLLDALSKYQNNADISHKYQMKPINDIFTAISLNEKYLYIKELFNNDPAFYKNTIEKLNSFDNFNQAVAFLDQQFKWDFDDFQVQRIIELVHRRYLPASE